MDHDVSGSVATRPVGSGRASSGRPGSSADRKSGATTRPGPGHPPNSRCDPSRPGQRPGLVPGTTRPAPCATPYVAAPPPVYRRPWALGLERLTVPPAVHAPIGDAVLVFVRDRLARPASGSVPGSGVRHTPLRSAVSRLPGAARRRRIDAGFHPFGQRWRGAEPAGTRVAEIAFPVTIGALAVLLTLALTSAVLPGAAASGIAFGFLAATGAFAGYASWRWVRWVRDRADRLHWSVITSAGAAVAAAELYGAAAIVASRSGFLERITAFGGLGFVAAVTVAVTGVASLVSYHRSVTDSQLLHSAHRFS